MNVSVADFDKLLERLTVTLVMLDNGTPLTWRVCEAARRILTADGAAITFDYTTDARVTLSATDDIAERLEGLQDVLGEGPSCDAYDLGIEITTSLGTDADRWPSFASAASEAFGEMDLHAIPIKPNNNLLGVLTAYFLADRSPAEHSSNRQFLANAVGAALLLDPESESTDDLQSGEARYGVDMSSWQSRAPINQAVGVIISQLGVGPHDALALLRAHAFARNVSLLSIAEETVHGRLDFSIFRMRGD